MAPNQEEISAYCGEPIEDLETALAISTVGAGDSAIAGFLTAAVKGESSEGRLAWAVAFGTAACHPCADTDEMPQLTFHTHC